jgi:hypothetical protein
MKIDKFSFLTGSPSFILKSSKKIEINDLGAQNPSCHIA